MQLKPGTYHPLALLVGVRSPIRTRLLLHSALPEAVNSNRLSVSGEVRFSVGVGDAPGRDHNRRDAERLFILANDNNFRFYR